MERRLDRRETGNEGKKRINLNRRKSNEEEQRKRKRTHKWKKLTTKKKKRRKGENKSLPNATQSKAQTLP